ncbi:apolipoprotein N-acyltransferase [Rugamonas sp. DEMB1]|uniref:apolipoprotein N-acyltransferase n=1 Tax=Rugamonas sp. DEMB1 TaxID=3039386 RepID=UPI00244C1A7D|nr:apolipoprotein N-acyltransferase [Rugamonas sp. DEMB1]WGG52626.1 apolipoprotein N-acyltransferase [Rugamonas sp. DEMB1]
MKQTTHPAAGMAVGVLASAAMSALYASGGLGYLLGFVLLVPWLRALDARRTLAGTLACAYAMSLAFTAAVFAWLGSALGRYTQVGETAGLAVLLLAAPLFQPQFLAFALARHLAGRRHGPLLRALAAAAAWLAAEWLLPRLLGDTLGHGLYPSRLLRQGADVGAGAGLTLLLLLANEAVAAALARRGDGWRAVAKPLALAALPPLLLAGYGLAALSGGGGAGAAASGGKPLRMGLIQANMVDYEGQRRLRGGYAVVREVLDRHFAMSYDAVVRQHADAVLWSETAYPTTFGQPKSEAGAEFDREILANVAAAGVPFVFGTYDRDGAGEYNAAAFVQPASGLLGFYRKTRLFPFTEYLPAWLDRPALRRLLPWTGAWRPGNGARVFPLRLADGREIPVLPMICLDDVDAGLAIDGARLGAQAILTMSNDSWFSLDRQGARLHQAAAAFRSIETRLPQFRVTTNGYSAVIDASGSVLAGTGMGEPALLVADLELRRPAPTLVVRWGDWVGPAAAAFLLLLAALAARRPQAGHAPAADQPAMAFPVKVALLPPAARLAAGLLRAVARVGLLGMCLALLRDDTLRSNTLAQIRLFAGLVLAPEAAAWCVLLAFAARATISDGKLVLSRGAQRIELALGDIGALDLWRLPVPGPGLALRLASGRRWRYGLALARPIALADAMAGAGGPPLAPRGGAMLYAYAQARQALRRWKLDHPLSKFVLFPLALAIPAFHLHQHIAYGSAFGEYYSYGLKAYLGAFMLWWAAWSIGVVLSAALLRAAIEAATLLVALLRPKRTVDIRRWLERVGRAALYLGLPMWLLLKLYGK